MWWYLRHLPILGVLQCECVRVHWSLLSHACCSFMQCDDSTITETGLYGVWAVRGTLTCVPHPRVRH